MKRAVFLWRQYRRDLRAEQGDQQPGQVFAQ
jgi:hypothetical protein